MSEAAAPSLLVKSLEKREVITGPGIQVSSLAGRFSKPVRSDVQVESSSHRICLSLGGSMVFSTGGGAGQGVLSRSGLLYMAGGTRTAALLSRGRHSWLEISWQRHACLALDEWVCENRTHPVACRSLLGSHAADGERTVGIVGLIADKSPRALPALLAYIHDLLGALFAEPPNGMLAAIPDDAQPVLVGLMKQVKAQPAADWSLKAAAAAAEYSAFHLSRTFRAAVGYGFPEFVDRCRTELAVKLLLSEDLDLAEVAEQAGFGSLQGMRNACKEYLGLLPSEIRSRLRPRFIRG